MRRCELEVVRTDIFVAVLRFAAELVGGDRAPAYELDHELRAAVRFWRRAQECHATSAAHPSI
jgi:hypothetical protein